MSATTENYKIGSTMLGVEDHGIFTFMIHLEGDGTSVGYGGYRLDRYDRTIKRCVGTAYGTEAIMRVLRVVGVNKWESLPGKPVRAKLDRPYGQIMALGNYLKNEWLDLKELAQEFIEEGV